MDYKEMLKQRRAMDAAAGAIAKAFGEWGDTLTEPAPIGHVCSFKRYRGLNEVIDYCECGIEKKVNWHEIGSNEIKIEEGSGEGPPDPLPS